MESGGGEEMKSGCRWSKQGCQRDKGIISDSRTPRDLQLSFDLCNPSNDHFTRLDASATI
jgi:hypothetical protein